MNEINIITIPASKVKVIRKADDGENPLMSSKIPYKTLTPPKRVPTSIPNFLEKM